MFKSSYFKLFNDDLIEKLSFEKRQLLRHRNDLQSAFVFKFVSSPVSSVHPGLVAATLFVVSSLSKLVDDCRNQFRSATRLFLLSSMDLVTRILCAFTMKGNVFLDRSTCDSNKTNFEERRLRYTSIIKPTKTIDLTFLFLCKYSQIYILLTINLIIYLSG